MKLVSESLVEFINNELYEFKEFNKTGDAKKTMNMGMWNQMVTWIRENTDYDVDGPYHYKNRNPLWICVKYNKPEFVKFLLSYGVDIHAHDDSALRWACGLGFSEIVAMLLDAGANPDAEDANGIKACYEWSRRNGHPEIIDLLDRSKKGEKFFEEEIEEPVKEIPQVVRQELPQLETPSEEEEIEDEAEEKNNWF